VIAIRELVSAEALRRYDDSGEPLYTTTERVLLTLRWFDWATAATLRTALGLDDADEVDKARYTRALHDLVKQGRVEKRGILGWHEYRLAPQQPALYVPVPPVRTYPPPREKPEVECRKCRCERVPGRVLCERHLQWDKSRARRNRMAG
jgi:hypothetical protein